VADLTLAVNCHSIPGNDDGRSGRVQKVLPTVAEMPNGEKPSWSKDVAAAAAAMKAANFGSGCGEISPGCVRQKRLWFPVTSVSFPKGLHSWSSEQSRYDHPAMKMIKKAKSSRRETWGEGKKWILFR
jgi:hypothetical protein